MNDSVYIGTDLKFFINVESSGFSQDSDDWYVVLMRGNREVKTYEKNDMLKDTEGNWFVCIETEEFSAGVYSIKIVAKVPDDDFPDGIRTEIYKQQLMTVSRA